MSKTKYFLLMTRRKSLFGLCTIMPLQEEPLPPLPAHPFMLWILMQYKSIAEAVNWRYSVGTLLDQLHINKKKLRKDLAKYSLPKFLVSCTSTRYFDKNYFMLAALDNFDKNADKNSLSEIMHAHHTTIPLFQVQPDNHIQKFPKDFLDLTNSLKVNKLRFIPSILLKTFHSVTQLKSKMSSTWSKHLKKNLRNVSSLSAAPKV